MSAQAETETGMTQSTVTLGEVEFDPVAIQDFRLSIEGTSGVGKSNTLAVILEDLADVRLPTLIIERLGALTPVRFEDEELIVVGARQEEGIDLAVGLEELDHVGEWVLDHGRKVLVDISTYEDYEEERSRTHLAAARALRSFVDRAHEKYRSGDRTKSLLVVDEAHMLAPKDSAPEPEFDEWVKRCRGQLIKVSTEGGNYGISTITAYQRRAFLHNGVIQLCDDYIAHKPGQEDIERTAKALRCDESTLAGLGTGEIVARGEAITGGELVGPTTVRKRRSPDPREETFELPEVSSQTEAFLEEIAETVEAERERRQQREDELERLRAENERLKDRVEELEQELADTDRLASALDNLQSGRGAAVEVGEGVEGLQERVDELKAERDRLEAARDELEAERADLLDENEELQERMADLDAEVQELRSAFEASAEAVQQLASTFDVDVELVTVPDQEVGTKEAASPEPDASPEQPTAVRDRLLSEFQEEAIDRVMAQLEQLSEREKKLLRYIESRGKPIPSQKAWAQRTFGLNGQPSGSHYESMKAVIESGFVRKNKDGSVTPAIRERVEEALDGYDVDRTTIGETHEQVLARLAP